jgi:PhoP regulatory network protein YrbL
MIILKDKEPIAVSGPRACYLHPNDDDKVIKIVRDEPFFRKHNANWQEWLHYNYLLEQHGKLDFVNDCYGFIKTDLGEGLVWQCVRDDSGDISSTITNIMKQPDRYDVGKVAKELERFCRFIIEKNIQLFDLNPLNVLIRIRSNGAYEAVSADIKGRYANHEFIPISTYIPFFSRRKLNRRCKELTDGYASFLRRREATNF